MIVFGHNNFRIKKYTFDQIATEFDEGWEGVTFEVRQRYFHLFWIPFFPIGKMYTIKKPGDSDKYEMPVSFQQAIDSKFGHEIKTPWYSWFLFLAAAVVGVGALGVNDFDSYQWSLRDDESFARQELMIDYPTTGDYYEFNLFESLGEDSWENETMYMKVESYTEDSIRFVSYGQDLISDESYLYGDDLYQKFDATEGFNYNLVSVAKADLKRCKLSGNFSKRTEIPNLGVVSFDNIIRRSLNDEDYY
jgi:hypothetical protein